MDNADEILRKGCWELAKRVEPDDPEWSLHVYRKRLVASPGLRALVEEVVKEALLGTIEAQAALKEFTDEHRNARQRRSTV